MLIILYISSNY